MSKAKAARISNAGRSAARKGGRSPSYDDMTKDQLMDRPATATSRAARRCPRAS